MSQEVAISRKSPILARVLHAFIAAGGRREKQQIQKPTCTTTCTRIPTENPTPVLLIAQHRRPRNLCRRGENILWNRRWPHAYRATQRQVPTIRPQRVVKRKFRRLFSRVGFQQVRLYDLRHTAVTPGIAAGISERITSDKPDRASC